jgi:hypothetical protein
MKVIKSYGEFLNESKESIKAKYELSKKDPNYPNDLINELNQTDKYELDKVIDEITREYGDNGQTIYNITGFNLSVKLEKIEEGGDEYVKLIKDEKEFIINSDNEFDMNLWNNIEKHFNYYNDFNND